MKSLKRLAFLGTSCFFLTGSGASGVPSTTVDLIIENGIILTVDADDTLHRRGFVAIRDGLIVGVGPSSERGTFVADEVLNVDGDIVMPGLINGHTHASMTVFRSLADDIKNRLHGYIFPLESRLVSREMVRVGAMLANLEMIKGGVTTYADMYYFEDVVAETVDEAGMRAVLGQTIIGFPVADAENADAGIEYATLFIKKYKNHALITPAFAPHAPYTNTTETLQEIARLSQEMDVPVLIHLAESEKERLAILERSGMSAIQYMDSIDALNDKVVAAHVVFADSTDIEILIQRSVGVSHNLSSNLKSGKGISPAIAMLERGVRIGLGTDGPMSANSLSTLSELNLVAKVHKLSDAGVFATNPQQIVRMSTMGGAAALHMDNEIGSIETGKFADIIVIDTKAPNTVPVYNPYSVVVYGANPSNVKHSIINGQFVMKNRVPMTLDQEEILNAANTYANKVAATLADMDLEIQ
jgi:5-methylthioadenosine/S-adenosylhomocysteine deaminase